MKLLRDASVWGYGGNCLRWGPGGTRRRLPVDSVKVGVTVNEAVLTDAGRGPLVGGPAPARRLYDIRVILER